MEANKKIDNYWIRYQGYGMCARNPISKVYQVAILKYKSAPSINPKAAIGYDMPQSTDNEIVRSLFCFYRFTPPICAFI